MARDEWLENIAPFEVSPGEIHPQEDDGQPARDASDGFDPRAGIVAIHLYHTNRRGPEVKSVARCVMHDHGIGLRRQDRSDERVPLDLLYPDMVTWPNRGGAGGAGGEGHQASDREARDTLANHPDSDAIHSSQRSTSSP